MVQGRTACRRMSTFSTWRAMVDRNRRFADKCASGLAHALIRRSPEHRAPPATISALENQGYSCGRLPRHSHLERPVRSESGQFRSMGKLVHATPDRKTEDRARWRHHVRLAQAYMNADARSDYFAVVASDRSENISGPQLKPLSAKAGGTAVSNATAALDRSDVTALPRELLCPQGLPLPFGATRPLGLTPETAERANRNRCTSPQAIGEQASLAEWRRAPRSCLCRRRRQNSNKTGPEYDRAQTTVPPFLTALDGERTEKTNLTRKTGGWTNRVRNSHG